MLDSFYCLLFFAGGFFAGLIIGLLAFTQCKRLALKVKATLQKDPL